MLERAYDLTHGYVGRTSYLIQEACAEAVLSGQEHISTAILESEDLITSLAALQHARTRAGRRIRRWRP